MLYEEALKVCPKSWCHMDPDKRYNIVPVSRKSKEFSEVVCKSKHFFKHGQMYRVQNPLLWNKFKMRINEYSNRGPYSMLKLYHNTSQFNVDSICQYNLDWRMGERFMFGPGVYFSVQPEIAVKHSSRKDEPSGAMFIFDVLVQNVQEVNEEIFLPEIGFDTILGHKKQTYVKYFDSEYYPSYFFSYV